MQYFHNRNQTKIRAQRLITRLLFLVLKRKKMQIPVSPSQLVSESRLFATGLLFLAMNTIIRRVKTNAPAFDLKNSTPKLQVVTSVI